MKRQSTKGRQTVAYDIFSTEFGWCAFVIRDGRLGASFLPERSRARLLREVLKGFPDARESRCADRTLKTELAAYFAGRRIAAFTAKPDFSGLGDFSRSVYTALLRIPYGRTVTYGELAALAGHPGAARAVGRAMSANPFAPVVPCHRVVGASGPGGFSGGKGLKLRMLAIEGSR